MELNDITGQIIDASMKVHTALGPGYSSQLTLAAGCYWSEADSERVQILDGDHKFVGHACEFETFLIMHLQPDLVDAEHVADAGQ